MDIRSQLEHSNYVPVDKGSLTEQTIAEMSKETSVLLVCDVAKGPDEQTRRSYVDGLVHAEIVSEDQVDAVLADESLVIVIPLHTLQVATEIYRRIQHASHFVSIWVDGKPYPGAC